MAPWSGAESESLAELLQEVTISQGIPGAVALIVDRDGVVHQSSSGRLDVANDVAMPLDAIFRIASMTKPVASLALMQQVEQGRVSLDDEVTTHLPSWVTPQVIAEAGSGTWPATRPITIRHILTNTSGLGYRFANPTLARLADGTTLTEFDLPLVHEPGARWTYSPGTRVAGWIVEALSGQSLEVYFQQEIFGPLGMVDTGYSVPTEKLHRLATLHRREDGVLVESANPAEAVSGAFGDGGLFSTAHDYGLFMRMLLNGGALNGARIVGPETVALMGENHIGDLVVEEQQPGLPMTLVFPLGAGRDKFGLGFQITAADDRYSAFRSPGSLSWAGAQNTHFWIDSSHGIAATVLMQILPFYDDAAIATLRAFEEGVYTTLAAASR